MKKEIKFNEPYYGTEETDNLSKYILKGIDFTKTVHDRIMADTHAGLLFPTGSATSAMEMYLASGLLPEGSEVIIPSFTYPAAANAVLSAGLKPVFADIDPGTLVMDQESAVKRMTEATSCIMPVHYGGASMDMDKLRVEAETRGIHILEDSALSYGAFYKERHLGTIGDAGVFSFHRTKNISGEGGGALIIRDPDKAGIFEEMLESGTNRRAFARGETKAYSWQRPGRGMNLSPLSAAVLAAQLGKLDTISSRRKHLWNCYYEGLAGLSEKGLLEVPAVPEYNKNNHHVFYIILKDNETREKLRKQLGLAGISAVIHYMPLHSSPFGRKLGYGPGDCPVSEDMAGRLLRLPMHMSLSEEDIGRICSETRRTLA